MVAIIFAAWLAVLLPSSGLRTDNYTVSCAVLVGSAALWLAGHRRNPGGELLSTVAGLAFLVAVGFLRQSAGGFASGVGILDLIPVVSAALKAPHPRQLWIVLTGMLVVLLAPVVFIGAPDYPSSQYRATILTVAVGAIIGIATQRLVAQVRREADASRHSHSLLEEVNRVARELYSSDDVRSDLSWAALRISDAAIAALLEPVPGESVMRATATAGMPGAELEIPMTRENPVGQAFLDRRRVLIGQAGASDVASSTYWEECGRPSSLLYEPLIRGDEAIGVLVVGWDAAHAAAGPRPAVVELLAHEAALVLDRADRVTALADLAQTDALTGLPNRRAWDARAALAARDGEEFAVAMLDVDHFKRFNDTHGHQAGDRLLRETAAAWRDQLRDDDLLARLGGEEFGLLLVGKDAPAAFAITERLRSSVTGGETCSAGVAVRRPGEPFESVVGRADQALYDAKAGGRDHARAAA